MPRQLIVASRQPMLMSRQPIVVSSEPIAVPRHLIAVSRQPFLVSRKLVVVSREVPGSIIGCLAEESFVRRSGSGICSLAAESIVCLSCLAAESVVW